MADEGLPDNHEVNVDGVDPEHVGDGVLDAMDVANNGSDGEWNKLQQTVDNAREDFGGNETEATQEKPINNLAEKLKDWPEEAQDIYTSRLAARLFRARHSDGSLRIESSRVRVYGGEIATIRLDREALCGDQIAKAQNSLHSGEISDGSWNDNTPKDMSMLRTEAMRVALASDKQRIREGIDLDNPLAGDFDGGLVAVEAIERASQELSKIINQGLTYWAETGELPKPEESDAEINEKLKKAIEDAIRQAINTTRVPGDRFTEGDDLSSASAALTGRPKSDGVSLITIAGYEQGVLAAGYTLIGDIRSPMDTETQRAYPNLHGFLSIDNIIAYMDQAWKEQEDEIKNREAAQQATAQRLSADMANFLSV